MYYSINDRDKLRNDLFYKYRFHDAKIIKCDVDIKKNRAIIYVRNDYDKASYSVEFIEIALTMCTNLSPWGNCSTELNGITIEDICYIIDGTSSLTSIKYDEKYKELIAFCFEFLNGDRAYILFKEICILDLLS